MGELLLCKPEDLRENSQYPHKPNMAPCTHWVMRVHWSSELAQTASFPVPRETVSRQ